MDTASVGITLKKEILNQEQMDSLLMKPVWNVVHVPKKNSLNQINISHCHLMKLWKAILSFQLLSLLASLHTAVGIIIAKERGISTYKIIDIISRKI